MCLCACVSVCLCVCVSVCLCASTRLYARLCVHEGREYTYLKVLLYCTTRTIPADKFACFLLAFLIACIRMQCGIHADDANAICGEEITQEGVIAVPANKLFLCSSVTNAAYRTTTEVIKHSIKAKLRVFILNFPLYPAALPQGCSTQY